MNISLDFHRHAPRRRAPNYFLVAAIAIGPGGALGQTAAPSVQASPQLKASVVLGVKVDPMLAKITAGQPMATTTFVVPKKAFAGRTVIVRDNGDLYGTLECDGAHRADDKLVLEKSDDYLVLSVLCHGSPDRTSVGAQTALHKLSIAFRNMPALSPVAPTATATARSESEIAGASIDGVAWRANRTLAVPTSFANKPFLNLNLFAGANPQSHFAFNLPLSKTADYVGAYAISASGPASGLYTPDMLDTDILSNRYEFTGTVSITSFDPNKQTVSGTFAGVAANRADNKTLRIEGGKFNNLEISAQR